MSTEYDPDTGLEVLTKQPAEKFLFDMDFSTAMLPDDTISSLVSSFPAQTKMGRVSGSADVTLSGAAHNSASLAQVWIEGGTDKENYKITFRVNTALGAIVEAEGMLYVRER